MHPLLGRQSSLLLIALAGCGSATITNRGGAEPTPSTVDCEALLEPAGHVHGRVVDQNGELIQGALVTAMWSDIQRNPCAHRGPGISDIRTDADGQFSFHLPSQLGVRLRFTHERDPAPPDDAPTQESLPSVSGYRYETMELELSWRHGRELRMDVVLGRSPCLMQVEGCVEQRL